MKPSSSALLTLQNSKGQVAIFVALVFQILFLFFAMVINVGLLVHHKINLQNAVDMAAYYGAMKQAENLNAMAHVNYQIRQSWKLLVFRYRALGTAGEDTGPSSQIHPFIKNPPPGFLQNPSDVLYTPEKLATLNPPFCITYLPFMPMPPNENTCRNIANGNSSVSLFSPPPIIAGFEGFTVAIAGATAGLATAATERCKIFGSFNYLTLGRFIGAYNEDQRAKMELIRGIASSMSESENTFFDIDGADVREGAIATLKNNLTAPNADGSSFDESSVVTYNSLGHANCSAKGLGQWPKWLAPIKVFPGYAYVDTDCGSAINSIAKELSAAPQNLPKHLNEVSFKNEVLKISSVLGIDVSNIFSPFNYSVGAEKNPWCVAYFGVKATASPKVPFSPFGRIKLTAQAFAKPFGGRMGPWYGKTWSPGNSTSNYSNPDANSKTDPLLPPRVVDQSILGEYKDPTRASNHSRYIGDQYGLKSRLPLGYWGQAVFRMGTPWNTSPPGAPPNFNDWNHLPYYSEGGINDILAWNSTANVAPIMRKLEVASVLPDLFDIAYYSIEPDFYRNYHDRLKAGLAQKLGIPELVRADIGYRGGVKELETFSVKDQYRVVEDAVLKNDLRADIKEIFKYVTTDWANTLTSWVSYGMGDYSVDEERFGQCKTPIVDGDDPTPSNCKSFGGTTGYGVKLVSPKYLNRSDLPLGGEGGPTGALENPVPSDF